MGIKYKNIYNSIKNKITTGVYKENEQIPDEMSLCKEYNCSRMTVKKALDMLVQEGLVYRKRGQGSFVMLQGNIRHRLLLQESELAGLTRSMPGKTKSTVLEFRLMFADEKIAQCLKININDPIYNIHRLRFIDNKPCILERTYMSVTLIPGITLEVLNHSIYDYIEQQLCYKIASAQKTSRADISTSFDHQYLLLKDIEPVLEVEQIAYLDNGQPFEYSITRHRYDYFEFTTYSVRR